MASTSVDPVSTAEAGYPRPEPPPPGQMTAGGSHWPTPHYQQFITFLNYVSRTYFWSHDEALRDSQCNTAAMWADPVISTAVRDRQRPVVQLAYQLEPRDPTNPDEKKLADILTQVLEDIPNFQQMRRSLLDALWYGRSGVQVIYDWDYTTDGTKRCVVRSWMPIHGDSLVFKFDGAIGVMVNPQLRGQKGVEYLEGRGGCAKFYDTEEEQCVLVHEFEPEPADYFRPESIGSVKGSGYRGRVYWYWWLKHNLMKIMFDFMRKVGNGAFLAGYSAGNRDEKAALQEGLEEQAGMPIFYVPLSNGRKLEETLIHLPISLQGADFQWAIIQGLNQTIRDAILGNSMANVAAPAGLGGSNAQHMGMTDDERVKYDAIDLETPLQKLVNVLAKHTMPGVRPPRFQHLADKREPGEIIETVMAYMQAGGTVPKPWFQEQIGVPEPKQGEEVLGMVQSQQATALGSVPAGVPLAGQPGPEQQGGGGQPAPGGQDDTAALASQIQPMPAAQLRRDNGVALKL